MNLKKAFLAICLICMSVLLFGESIEGTLTFDSSKITITQAGIYDAVEYDGDNLIYNVEPGEPDLPKYGFQVLIPENAIITGVSVSAVSKSVVDPSFNAYPAQEQTNPDKTPPVFAEPKSSVYTSNTEFPYSDTITYINNSEVRGYKMAVFTLNLFSYKPVSDDLYFINSIDYSVQYELDPMPPVRNVNYSIEPNKLFRSFIQAQVQNPASIDTFRPYDDGGVLTSRSDSSEQVDFLIITSNALKSAFESYAADRAKTENLNTKVVTTEYIYANYTGPTEQLKIKKCISEYVANHDTNYVMLGGDDTIVPIQQCYTEEGKSIRGMIINTMAVDLFYACFDNTFDWNSDGDDKVGEKRDGVDFSPDVFLGRLPVRTAQHVADYQEKVRNYMHWIVNTDYLQNRGILFISKKLKYTGDSRIKNKKLFDEFVAPYWDDCRNEFLSDDDPDYELTKTLIQEEMDQRFNAVHYSGHGSEQGVGDYGIEEAAVISGRPFGVFATIACASGMFEYSRDPSLSEAMLRNRNGGPVVYLGSGENGWVTSFLSQINDHAASFTFNDKFFYYLLENPYSDYLNTMSVAFSRVKQNGAGWAEGGYTPERWVLMAMNFQGDPTLKFFENDEPFRWERMRNTDASAVAAGADGTVCMLGTENLANGSKVYKYNGDGSWKVLSGAEGVKIDVDPTGNPWIVNKNGTIYKWTGSSWQSVAGQAKDISIGGNGVVYIIDKNSGGSRGNYIAYWNGSGWTHIDSVEAVSISVDGKGNPWIVDINGHISRYTGTHWEALPGKATDIAVGADGKAFIAGDRNHHYGHPLYRWTGQSWQQIEGWGDQVEVGPNGAAYAVDTRNDLFFGHPEKDLVFNGDFHSYYPNGWTAYTMEGGAAVLSNQAEGDGHEPNHDIPMYYEELKVSVTEGGTEKWSVLVTQNQIPVEKGETYTVSFWARQANAGGSSIESDITISLNADPWTEYALFKATFTETLKRYSFTFTMDEATDNNAIFQFCLGKLKRDVYIDNVSILKHVKDTKAPTIPMELVVSATENSIELSWDDSIDSSGYVDHIIKYKKKSESTYTEVSTKNNSYTITGLAADTEYNIILFGRDSSGNVSEDRKKNVTTQQRTLPDGSWTSDAVYYGGDVVTYEGNTYKARWWTQGETPGIAYVWELQ